MSAGSPQFPPSVADRLQEPQGSAVVHVTPAARTRRPSDLRWLLMATLDRPVLATLVLDNAGRLKGGSAAVARPQPNATWAP